jgi:glycerol-1-phosphate dehydrogenase [NAD(P)+]
MRIDMAEFRKPCSCGRQHEIIVDDIIIEQGAIEKLPEILARKEYASFKKIAMVCDENTYEAAGKKVASLLPDLAKVILDPDNLHANEHGVEAAKKELDKIGDVDLMIAVGSGTVHDITRYHAYNMKIPFFSVPTAASVDGFVSTVAAMTWHGFKKSFTAVSPIVVIADSDIFKNAPMRLTASGVADLLGKYTALADWKIAHVLTGEYICKEICDLEYRALDELIQSLDGLNNGDAAAYEQLMYGLLLSGIAMQMTGNSRPASGAEHHMSHLWEMEVYNDYIDFYHGEKVGVGLVTASKIYHQAAKYMKEHEFSVKEKMDVEEEAIKNAFTKPGMYESIMEENTPNLLELIHSQDLIDKKDEIIKIIEEIPTADELKAMLAKVKGVNCLEDLGFDHSFQKKTAFLSPYVRARITYMRVLKFYDFYEQIISE